jgi:hypothetical protein
MNGKGMGVMNIRQQNENDWEIIGKALNIGSELEKAGLNVEKYLQDVRDNKVKPIDYYWQTCRADKT